MHLAAVGSGVMPRNVLVERAVDHALTRIDVFIERDKLNALPNATARAAMDRQLGHGSGSVRLASLFFIFYSGNLGKRFFPNAITKQSCKDFCITHGECPHRESRETIVDFNPAIPRVR